MNLLADYTLQIVALGAAILGITSGSLGSYAVLRGQSLMGDAISHATLPGICLLFLITGTKTTSFLLLGAFLSGWLAILVIKVITTNTRIKYDSTLGLILSVFFGFGLVLLTFIQKQPNANQAGLDKFLFGQASTLLKNDVVVMGIVSSGVLLLILVFWKEFKILCFDPDFAQSLGFPIKILDLLLTTLLVITIIIGLQTVGVILMSAMIIAPAVAARLWTNKLSTMMILASFLGALSGVTGTLISSLISQLPTGPVIIIIINSIIFLSLLIAPQKGLISKKLTKYKKRQEIINQNKGGDGN